ncbi:4396_t:CDS:1, partial [Acaulospora colombiana]
TISFPLHLEYPPKMKFAFGPFLIALILCIAVVSSYPTHKKCKKLHKPISIHKKPVDNDDDYGNGYPHDGDVDQWKHDDVDQWKHEDVDNDDYWKGHPKD